MPWMSHVVSLAGRPHQTYLPGTLTLLQLDHCKKAFDILTYKLFTASDST